jgi:3-oxoacyl-[acyl-carrier protein] reductase
MNLNDKVALVTGASRGIGRHIAQQFAAHGARIALHYRGHQTEAEETLASLTGDGHQLFQADLTDAAAAQALIQNVANHFGRLDVLVNNAGVFFDHPLAQLDYDAWQKAWRATIETAQQMIKQGGGKIINVSSRGAFRGEPDAPAYGASKAGLNAMSQSLAQALAPHNVFVYVLAPGFVDTERVSHKVQGETGAAIRNQSPLRRVALPEEVARTALFLASEGTDFLTGGIVDINGASYLRS